MPRYQAFAVGTPSAEDGSADLSSLWSVVDRMAPHLSDDALVVIKSTVPVGTNAQVSERLRELAGRECRRRDTPTEPRSPPRPGQS